MNYDTFIRKAYDRISKMKFIILSIAVVSAVMVFFYCKSTPKIYSSTATVFPLNATNDNAGAASALSSLLGLSETPKSFIQEASINIVDLALSRNTREAVAMVAIPNMSGKTIAELVINEYNQHKPFYKKSIALPSDSIQLAATGAKLLKETYAASINKNGILEIHYASTNAALLKEVTYVFVDKISTFYKELKIRKAKLDYDFMNEKVDSLELILAGFDKDAISMSNTTLFVPTDKLQYQMPKLNLSSEKSRVMRQRDLATDNREEALWRLQKVTPIIAMLDKPEPPFDEYKPSAVLYALITMMAVSLLLVLLLIALPLASFLKTSIKDSLFQKG